MKKICLLLTIAILTIIGCSKDNDPKFLDPKSKISLTGMDIPARSSEIDTIDVIIRHCDNIRFRSIKEGYEGKSSLPNGEYYYNEVNSTRRDFENKKILFGGGYVIDVPEDNPEWSRLGSFITNAEDVIFAVPVSDETGEFLDLTDAIWFTRPFHLDTLGYIPNRILKKAQQEIKDAYAAEDFERCYRVFDTEFRFYPITGERWRALKSAGIE